MAGVKGMHKKRGLKKGKKVLAKKGRIKKTAKRG